MCLIQWIIASESPRTRSMWRRSWDNKKWFYYCCLWKWVAVVLPLWVLFHWEGMSWKFHQARDIKICHGYGNCNLACSTTKFDISNIAYRVLHQIIDSVFKCIKEMEEEFCLKFKFFYVLVLKTSLKMIRVNVEYLNFTSKKENKPPTWA